MRRIRCADDPAYAVETDRVALADAVSAVAMQFRAERGDVMLSFESLQRLARASVLEVHVGRTGALVRELVCVMCCSGARYPATESAARPRG